MVVEGQRSRACETDNLWALDRMTLTHASKFRDCCLRHQSNLIVLFFLLYQCPFFSHPFPIYYFYRWKSEKKTVITYCGGYEFHPIFSIRVIHNIFFRAQLYTYAISFIPDMHLCTNKSRKVLEFLWAWSFNKFRNSNKSRRPVYERESDSNLVTPC